MTYPSYLIHFNRLHDKKGRFTYGDGDGDGRRNDRVSSEGDRSGSYVNSGRRNYEGGGGGRFGTHSNRSKSGSYSKPQASSNNSNPYSKPSSSRTTLSSKPSFTNEGTSKMSTIGSSRYANIGNKASGRYPGGGGGGSTGVVAYGGKPVAEEDDEEKKMIDRKYIDAGKALVDEYKKKLANTTMSKSLSKMMTLSTSNRSSGYRGQNSKGDRVKIRVGHQHDNG